MEKALQSGAGSAAEQQRDRNDRLEDRLGDLEGLVEEQGREMRAGRRAAEDEIRKLREEQSQAYRKLERALAGLNRDDGSGSGWQPVGSQSPKTATVRREYPELVTLDPAGDDEKVFGDAWEMVQEWRELKDTHPNEGRGLDWLLTEERFLAVELELLEDRGLTLPRPGFPCEASTAAARSIGAARPWTIPGGRSEGGNSWRGPGAS